MGGCLPCATVFEGGAQRREWEQESGSGPSYLQGKEGGSMTDCSQTAAAIGAGYCLSPGNFLVLSWRSCNGYRRQNWRNYRLGSG